MADNATKCSAADGVTQTFVFGTGSPIMVRAADFNALFAEYQKLRDQRDELRRALEIIAVGDAENPQAQAAEELIALGYWRDIPEARKLKETGQ